MEPSSDPEKTTNQSPWMGNAAQAQIQPQFPEQQIIVINPKYKPDFNLRIWSTFILLGGVITSFALPFIGLDQDLYMLLEMMSIHTIAREISKKNLLQMSKEHRSHVIIKGALRFTSNFESSQKI